MPAFNAANAVHNGIGMNAYMNLSATLQVKYVEELRREHEKKEAKDMSTVVIPAFNDFTFGCDPELFVLNAEGVAVSADGLIPGTKNEPYPVPGGAVQVDGVAAEFNILPSKTFEEFDENIVTVMDTLKKMLPKGYNLSAVPAKIFNEDVWAGIPDTAKELGCNPDFDAWAMRVNPPPECSHPRLRTAAGHLHIGWTEGVDEGDIQHISHATDLVKQLDWYLGAWSVRHDSDTLRRTLYGKAGACRIKPYGVEYRVLSNFWVTGKDMRRQVWNRMQRALMDMQGKYFPSKSRYSQSVRDVINTAHRDPYLEKEYPYPISRIF